MIQIKRMDSIKWMQRAIQLAKNGSGRCKPNPRVGAVVVYEDRMIGQGYHPYCGAPHAEVVAIERVADKSLLAKSTLYVTLEPCSHWGKTPPCVELIVRVGIPHVVIATLDPHIKVAGRGVKRLQEAGVEVEIGVCADQAMALNRDFMTFHTLHRPYVILKWAQSADGYIDYYRNSISEAAPLRLSTPFGGVLQHQLRGCVQAILVGTRTALLDNPSLTTRRAGGSTPLRVVIDRRLKIPSGAALLDGAAPTWIITELAPAVASVRFLEYKQLAFDSTFLTSLMSLLAAADIHSLLVEGGAYTHQLFLEQDLWDEIEVESANMELSEGVKAPSLSIEPDYRLPFGEHTKQLYYRSLRWETPSS